MRASGAGADARAHPLGVAGDDASALGPRVEQLLRDNRQQEALNAYLVDCGSTSETLTGSAASRSRQPPGALVINAQEDAEAAAAAAAATEQRVSSRALLVKSLTASLGSLHPDVDTKALVSQMLDAALAQQQQQQQQQQQPGDVDAAGLAWWRMPAPSEQEMQEGALHMQSLLALCRADARGAAGAGSTRSSGGVPDAFWEEAYRCLRHSATWELLTTAGGSGFQLGSRPAAPQASLWTEASDFDAHLEAAQEEVLASSASKGGHAQKVPTARLKDAVSRLLPANYIQAVCQKLLHHVHRQLPLLLTLPSPPPAALLQALYLRPMQHAARLQVESIVAQLEPAGDTAKAAQQRTTTGGRSAAAAAAAADADATSASGTPARVLRPAALSSFMRRLPPPGADPSNRVSREPSPLSDAQRPSSAAATVLGVDADGDDTAAAAAAAAGDNRPRNWAAAHQLLVVCRSLQEFELGLCAAVRHACDRTRRSAATPAAAVTTSSSSEQQCLALVAEAVDAATAYLRPHVVPVVRDVLSQHVFHLAKMLPAYRSASEVTAVPVDAYCYPATIYSHASVLDAPAVPPELPPPPATPGSAAANPQQPLRVDSSTHLTLRLVGSYAHVLLQCPEALHVELGLSLVEVLGELCIKLHAACEAPEQTPPRPNRPARLLLHLSAACCVRRLLEQLHRCLVVPQGTNWLQLAMVACAKAADQLCLLTRGAVAADYQQLATGVVFASVDAEQWSSHRPPIKWADAASAAPRAWRLTAMSLAQLLFATVPAPWAADILYAVLVPVMDDVLQRYLAQSPSEPRLRQFCADAVHLAATAFMLHELCRLKCAVPGQAGNKDAKGGSQAKGALGTAHAPVSSSTETDGEEYCDTPASTAGDRHSSRQLLKCESLMPRAEQQKTQGPDPDPWPHARLVIGMASEACWLLCARAALLDLSAVELLLTATPLLAALGASNGGAAAAAPSTGAALSRKTSGISACLSATSSALLGAQQHSFADGDGPLGAPWSWLPPAVQQQLCDESPLTRGSQPASPLDLMRTAPEGDGSTWEEVKRSVAAAPPFYTQLPDALLRRQELLPLVDGIALAEPQLGAHKLVRALGAQLRLVEP